MTPRTLIELFERHPSPDSALFIDGAEGLASYTYGHAWSLAAKCAGVFRELGVAPGDRVAVQVDKSSEAIIVYLACLRAGAVLVPLNPGATSAELEYLLADAEPALVIADPLLAAARTQLPLLTLDAEGGGTLLARASDLPVVAPAFLPTPDTTAAMVYTSGTTGRPKGAVVTHRNLTANAVALRALWEFGPTKRLLHMLPVFHVHGLFVATNCTIAGGGSMVFAPRFDVDVALAQLPRCTVMMGVPTFYTRLLADDRFDATTCASTRLIISGSAPLLAATHREFEARTGHTILERYGMSETSMSILMRSVSLCLPSISSRRARWT